MCPHAHMRLVVRAYTVLVNVYVENVAENVSFILGSSLALDSLGEFWKSALHKSKSAKAPGAGEGEERMDNDGARQ